MMQFQSQEQVDAGTRVVEDLNHVWRRTRERERKFRMAALSMYLVNLTNGREGWDVTPSEKELGEFLVAQPLSEWLVIRLDNEGDELLSVSKFPPGWTKKVKKEKEKEPEKAKAAPSAVSQTQSEIEALLDAVGRKK